MKRLVIVVFAMTILITIYSHAQHGTSNSRKVGNLNSNQIKTVFLNTGVIAQPGTEGPRFSWQYTHNSYSGDMSILLGLELPIKDYWRGNTPPDGIQDTIHSVIITPVDRPGGGEGENGVSYTFEPLPGYFNPNINEIGRGVALSTDIESWPTLWPDHPEYGSGVWNGLNGPNNFVGDQEALFVIDDFNDLENNIQNHFYPDSTNTNFTGHGIEIKIRYVGLNNPLFQDVLFKIYDIKNKSLYNYNKLVLGNLTGSYVGGEAPEYSDDVTLFYPKDNMIVTYDFDKYVNPSVNPNWIGEVGMFGETFIHTPTNNKIASFNNFVPAGTITMSDDEYMWSTLKPGLYQWPSSVFYQDSVPYATRGEDGDYIWGGEYFTLNAGETKRFVTVSAFGYSPTEILKKAKYAEALYHSNFDLNLALNSISINNPSYHKVITNNELISWTPVIAGTTVQILYSSDAGSNWVTVVDNIPNTGTYNWNTTTVSDGYFTKIMIVLKNSDGFITSVKESNYFTVNNLENGKPFIAVLNENLEQGITGSQFDFNLLMGDPENDPMQLNIFYSINSDSTYHLSQTIEAASDTIVQIIPVNIGIIPNTNRLKLKFELTDGANICSTTTREFTKQTQRQTVGSEHFEWIKRYAQSSVDVRVADPTKLTGDEYVITFSDTLFSNAKAFSVYDKTINQYVILNSPLYLEGESMLFDGLVLYTEDFFTTFDMSKSKWNNSRPNNLHFNLLKLVLPTIQSYNYPYDYKLVFSDTYNDSSNTLLAVLGSYSPPVNPNINFKVYRSVEEIWERTQFAFVEPLNLNKNILSNGDVVILSNPSGNELSWRVVFLGDTTSNIPSAEDTLFICTKKGLSVFDSIRVHDIVSDVNEKHNELTNFLLEQNYPNPFNPNTIIKYSISGLPIGQAGMQFVTLKIYDILGREVATLVNEEKVAGNYKANFNASSLASGVYIYQLKAGNFVQAKKMILMK